MNTNSKLYQEVNQIIKKQLENDYTLEEFISDLMYGGCQSCLVGEMIYYKDTIPFYQRHQEEINTMLKEMLFDTGYTCPAELFGDKWDKEDPLAFEIMNQNLLAWYAFEETARQIAYDNDLDI